MIGKLLGHTQVQTNARYVHLANASVKASGSRVGYSIGMQIKGLIPVTRHLGAPHGVSILINQEAICAAPIGAV